MRDWAILLSPRWCLFVEVSTPPAKSSKQLSYIFEALLSLSEAPIKVFLRSYGWRSCTPIGSKYFTNNYDNSVRRFLVAAGLKDAKILISFTVRAVCRWHGKCISPLHPFIALSPRNLTATTYLLGCTCKHQLLTTPPSPHLGMTLLDLYAACKS